MLSTNTKRERYWLTDLCYLALFLGLFYAIWIGSHALFTPDEGRYSEVAREMVASGDYITPRLNGVAFLDKPVLYYWLQASAIQLFGLKEWALRFWPALMGILGCLVAYLAGSILFSRRSGIISALILATCPLYYGAAHYANLDLEVAVLIGNSLLFFLIATQLPESRRKHLSFFAAYIFAAFAFLTKGLIAIAFPAAIIGSWILLLNRWNLLRNMRLFSGILLFLCITVPWYVLAQKATPEFLHFFFITQQITRFLTKADFNNKAAWWFYVPIVLAGIFPWMVFVVQAIGQHVKKVWNNRQQHAASLFLLLWLLIIFTFFSIPKSKTVGYILPIFPTLALLIGSYLDEKWNDITATGMRIGLRLFTLLCSILAIAFFAAPHIAAWHVKPGLAPYLYVCGILFGLAALASRLMHGIKAFASMAVTAVIFLLIMSASATAINERSIKPLITQLQPILQPNDEIVTFYKFYYDLPIYTQRRITMVADWTAPDIEQNDNWVRELWYGMPFQDTKDWLISDATFLKKWNSNKRLFVFTDNSNYERLKNMTKAPVYEVARYRNVVLVANRRPAT